MRILAFAYACEPGKGSEPGAGWIWARMLARIGDTWVITRANNAATIETHLPSMAERDRLHFIYVDLPNWARFWKRGQRGVRFYYLLWQVAARRKAVELHRQIGFDVSWHLTIANAWLGSLGGLRGLPFIYGPVGGGVSMPWRLLPALGVRGSVYELIRSVMRASGRFLNPVARLAWKKADLILAQNPDTAAWFPSRHREKTSVFPNAMVENLPSEPHIGRKDGPTALVAGRLLAWKGTALAIRAIAALPDWRLLICGEGPDEHRLRSIARQTAVSERIAFLGTRPRSGVLELMRTCDVLICPSLREEASFVVVEAVACGLPVVYVDRGGPPILAGPAGVAVGFDSTIKGLIRRLEDALTSGLPSRDDVQRRGRELTLDARTEELIKILVGARLIDTDSGATSSQSMNPHA